MVFAKHLKVIKNAVPAGLLANLKCPLFLVLDQVNYLSSQNIKRLGNGHAALNLKSIIIQDLNQDLPRRSIHIQILPSLR
jgi:hypothetical protein